MAERADLAYLAGMVDADGHISLRRNAPGSVSVIPVVGVTNACESLLEWLKAWLGGNISKTRSGYAAHRSTLTWQLSGDRAVALLAKLQPLLRIKRTQAWLTREFWAQRTPAPKGRGRRVSAEEQALRLGYLAAMHFVNAPKGKP